MGTQSRSDTGDPLTSLVVARGLRAVVDGLGGVGQALLTAGLAVVGGLPAVHRLGLARGASGARLGLERGRILGRGSEISHTPAPGHGHADHFPGPAGAEETATGQEHHLLTSRGCGLSGLDYKATGPVCSGQVSPDAEGVDQGTRGWVTA